MNDYLQNLETMLDRFIMHSDEKHDIMEDYKAMIEEAKASGLTDDEVIEKLGSVDAIYQAMKPEYRLKKKIANSEKWIALSPFIALIIFFFVGFQYEAWHPGWMAFLLIPLTAIIVEGINHDSEFKLTALMPFLSVIAFVLLGIYTGAWHPAWLVFLSIPMMGIIESSKEKRDSGPYIGTTVFLSIIVFFLVGYFTGVYTPTWVILLTPILFDLFFFNGKKNHYIVGSSLLVSMGLYSYLGLYVTSWPIALLAFMVFIVVGLITGHVTIVINTNHRYGVLLKISFAISLVLFLLLGYLYDAYQLTWLFVLLTPMFSIVLTETRRRWTALSPFVAIITFMLIGFFLDGWAYAWLVFLLIPMVAIIEGD